MKCLITGIEGFVGGYLAEKLLELGFEVYGTYFDYRTLTKKVSKSVKLYNVDIRNNERLSNTVKQVNPNTVFHLAAQSSASLSWKSPKLTMDINVGGTINLLETIKEYSPETKLISIGSSEQYGSLDPEENPVSESHQLNPQNPYAISKTACERLCIAYAQAYSLNIVMARSFNHAGPGQPIQFVMSDFAYQIAQIKLNKKKPLLKAGNLKAERDFTDVRDVVQAYIILADKGERRQVYNIGSGTANSIEYYLNKMIEKASIDIKIEVEKERLRPIDTPLICCDNSRIKKLGWIPQHNIADTFMEMIDYHKQSIPGSNQ